ncbi:hypothetical protein BpHYR1_003136 [Brachionus plicatilis]|uniref:Uncharacterized protein n=1 Tax=Brachionus plicatilis TaxID=10195 RepID=A0A3M7QAI0_BRAPC|nr:hypothetical protein BpHYR1_003136 [Brachionus plicatilis]
MCVCDSKQFHLNSSTTSILIRLAQKVSKFNTLGRLIDPLERQLLDGNGSSGEDWSKTVTKYDRSNIERNSTKCYYKVRAMQNFQTISRYGFRPHFWIPYIKN